MTPAKESIERTRNYLKQIKGAVVFRGGSVLASFIYVPMMIEYLGQDKFGIWSTLLSIVSWVLFFDLGVGNGLRNKVTESLSKNDSILAQKYIASGYTLIGMLILVLWFLFMAVSYFVSWQFIFNTNQVSEASIRLTVQIALSFVLLNFWLSLIASVLSAVHQISMVAFGQFISNTMALGFVFTLSKISIASLPLMATAYGFSLIFGNIFLSYWLYGDRKNLRPEWFLKMEYVRPLMSLGIQFFVIQLAVLVIFTTDKILITQLFGPRFVTPYEAVFKLFSLVTVAHAIISAPLWSAYAEAYQRKDMTWISLMLARQKRIFVGFLFLIIVLALFSQNIISVWIGEDIDVSSGLIMAMALFVIISTWNNIFAMFINGTGRMRVQLITATIAMIVNIPLALLFTKYFSMNISGVVLATCVSLSFASIALPIQVRSMLATDRL